jgi:hypothetical protein
MPHSSIKKSAVFEPTVPHFIAFFAAALSDTKLFLVTQFFWELLEILQPSLFKGYAKSELPNVLKTHLESGTKFSTEQVSNK